MRGLTSISSVVLLTGVFTIATEAVLAQTGPVNRNFPWEGEVTGSSVYIRSGAGSNYYPTTKVGPGTRLLVIGEKFGWYEIIPPIGSFSYIDATLVQKSEDGTKGTVTQENVYVRAGSELERRKTSTQTLLTKGATVTIIGEADGFLKVVPPKGASLFISAQYVAPVPERTRSGLLEKYMSEGGPVSSAIAPEPAAVAVAKKPENRPAAVDTSKISPIPASTSDAEPRSIKTDVAIASPFEDASGSGVSKPAIPVDGNANRTTATHSEPVVTAEMAHKPIAPVTGDNTTGWIESQFASSDGTPPRANASSSLSGGASENPMSASVTYDNSKAASVSRSTPAVDNSPYAKSPPSNATTINGRNVTTVVITAPAGSGRYDAAIQMLEAEMQSELRKPIRDQKLASLRDRFGPISQQTEEPVAQEIAKIRIRQLNDRISLQNSRMALASEAKELEAFRRRSDEERIAIGRRVASYSAPVSYDVVGELRKSMAFGPDRHRYRLVNPKGGATLAYVDIPPSVSPNVDQWIGQIVGIKASGKDYSNAARMTFYVAESVTSLGTGSGEETAETPIDKSTIGADDPAGTISFSSPTPTFSTGPDGSTASGPASRKGGGDSTMTIEMNDARGGRPAVEKAPAGGNTSGSFENTDMEPLEPIGD